MRDHAGIEVFVMYLDIPGRVTADFDAAVGQQGSDATFEAGKRHLDTFIDAGACG